MTKEKFTEGPWTVERTRTGELSVESEDIVVTDFYVFDKNGNVHVNDNAEANANLIAQATAMYHKHKETSQRYTTIARILRDEGYHAVAVEIIDRRDEIDRLLSKARGE